MSLPFRIVKLASPPDQVKAALLSGELVPYYKQSGIFTLGGAARHMKWSDQSDGSLLGKLGYFRSKNQCIYRFRMIFVPHDTGTELTLKVEHGPYSLILKILLYVIGVCLCVVGVVFSFFGSSMIMRSQNYILQFLQGHLIDWDRDRNSHTQPSASVGLIPPPFPSDLLETTPAGEQLPEEQSRQLSERTQISPPEFPSRSVTSSGQDDSAASVLPPPACGTPDEDSVLKPNRTWRLSHTLVVIGLLAACVFAIPVIRQVGGGNRVARKTEKTSTVTNAAPDATDANGSNMFNQKLLGSWTGNAIITFFGDGSWGIQANKDSPHEMTNRTWKLEGRKLLLLIDGKGGWVNIARLDDSILITRQESGREDWYERASGISSGEDARSETMPGSEPPTVHVVGDGIVADQYRILFDHEKSELIVEFEWIVRFGAVRHRAKLDALDLGQTSTKPPAARGAFRGCAAVVIPVKQGRQVDAQFWKPVMDNWDWSIPPDGSRAETNELVIHVKAGGDVQHLVKELIELAGRSLEKKPSEATAMMEIQPSAESLRFSKALDSVWAGIELNRNQLTGLTIWELKLLRNAVFARHHRKFDSAKLSGFFHQYGNNKDDPAYSDRMLTAADHFTIQMIQPAEGSVDRTAPTTPTNVLRTFLAALAGGEVSRIHQLIHPQLPLTQTIYAPGNPPRKLQHETTYTGAEVFQLDSYWLADGMNGVAYSFMMSALWDFTLLPKQTSVGTFQSPSGFTEIGFTQLDGRWWLTRISDVSP